MKYSEELILAMSTVVGQDDDCDLCLMFGVGECHLHRTTGFYEMEMVFRDLVTDVDRKADVTLQYNGLVFRAVFSDISNRWVLVNEGVSEDGD